MASEPCKACAHESTPWEHRPDLEGHICRACSSLSRFRVPTVPGAEHMKHALDLVRSIVTRPSMYLSGKLLREVALLMNGFDTAGVSFNKCEVPKSNFMHLFGCFVSNYLGDTRGSHGWPSMIYDFAMEHTPPDYLAKCAWDEDWALFMTIFEKFEELMGAKE